MGKKSNKFTYPETIETGEGQAKLLAGSNGYYASKNGDIFSVWICARAYNFGELRFKKIIPQENVYGYLSVYVVVDGKQKKMSVHRVVAECFLGKSTMPVDHIDRDKKNNNLSNLRYVTNIENSRNAKRGDSRKVLNEFSVLTICTLAGIFTRSEIANAMGINVKAVKSVCTRKTHFKITKNLEIKKLKAGKKDHARTLLSLL